MSMSEFHVNASCQCQCSLTYIEMPECRTVQHPVSPVSDWKKLTMSKPVRYRTKLTQSGIFLVRYRTKIRNARMLMPALVSSMPMPSYEYKWIILSFGEFLWGRHDVFSSKISKYSLGRILTRQRELRFQCWWWDHLGRCACAVCF
jgi:hypothetical protein